MAIKNLKRLVPYVSRYKWSIIGGFIALALANYFTLQVARVVGEASDAIKQGGHAPRDFMMYAGGIVGFTALMGIFRYAMRQWIIGASRDIELEFRDDLFSKLQSLSASFYDQQRTGDLMAKATSDVEQVRSFIGPGFLQFFNSTILFPLAAWRMWVIDPRLMLITMAPLISLPFVMNFFGNRVHKRFRQVQDHYSHISAMVQENLAGVRVVKAFVQEEAQQDKFGRLNREFIDMNMGLARIQSGFYPSLRVLAGLSIVLLIYVGARDVINGTLTVGELVEFSLIQTMLFWPMIAMGWTVSLMQRGAASMDRLADILDLPSYTPPIPRDHVEQAQDEVPPPKDDPGSIEFRNLSFRYGANLPVVLSNININVPAGTRLGIVGQTGSGKTTFASLLAGLYSVEPGMMFIDGQDVNELSVKDLRARVGFVFQETFLFSDSIRNNIRFSNSDAGDAEIERVAKAAHIHEDIMGFPGQYDTILGERGINLSGGQKQRTAIARALLRDPGILVLDDALSAVDTETEAQILRSLHEELQGRTAVIIAHRVSAVMNCEQIIVLDEGRIAESGTHEALLKQRGIYSGLFEKQLLADAIELEIS